MQMVVNPQGQVRCLYSEDIDLTCLGIPLVRRASYVEPDDAGRWWADLAPVNGPMLGPFQCRSQALDAETTWLNAHLPALSLPSSTAKGKKHGSD
jgi:hypothetical protein